MPGREVTSCERSLGPGLIALAFTVVLLGACAGGGGGGGGGEADTGSDTNQGDTGECTPGELACACEAGSCGEDLACSDDNLCIETTGTVVGVDNPDVRACEVLIHDAEHVISDVNFGDAVHGQFMRRGRLVAFGFYADADAPVPDGSIELRSIAALDDIEVRVNTCYGPDGALLSDAELGLE